MLKKPTYDFVNGVLEPGFMKRILKINDDYETETQSIKGFYNWRTN